MIFCKSKSDHVIFLHEAFQWPDLLLPQDSALAFSAGLYRFFHIDSNLTPLPTSSRSSNVTCLVTLPKIAGLPNITTLQISLPFVIFMLEHHCLTCYTFYLFVMFIFCHENAGSMMSVFFFLSVLFTVIYPDPTWNSINIFSFF